MNDLFISDDILESLKKYVDIRDYSKLTLVSRKYKKYFDLNPLIAYKSYSSIMSIKGCSIDILINIITKNTIKKYSYPASIDVNKKIIKNKNEFSIDIKYKAQYILQSLIELYYNCYNNEFKNMIKTLRCFRNMCSVKINLNNFTYFITPIMAYIDDIQEETIRIHDYNNDKYSAEENKDNAYRMLLHINLNLFLAIIIKKLNTIIPCSNPSFKDLDLLFSIIQNDKLNHVVYNVRGEYFPDYYVKYVNELCESIYIGRV